MSNTNCCPKAENCLNPIIEIFDNLRKAISVETEAGLKSYEEGLGRGVILSHNGNICCPDCQTSNGYYFLGKAERLLGLLEFTGQAYPCCINHSLDSETYNELVEAIGKGVPCCKTEFSSIISEIGLLGLNSLDVVEASSFNGHSGLANFLEYADLENIPTADVISFLTAVFELGLVIKCEGCNIFIGSVETYSKYIPDIYIPI